MVLVVVLCSLHDGKQETVYLLYEVFYTTIDTENKAWTMLYIDLHGRKQTGIYRCHIDAN